MNVRFTISPTLASEGGMESTRTPMLMLTKIQGMGLGGGPKAIDEACDGLLSHHMEQQGFTGGLAQAVTVELGDESPQQNLVMMGLGTVGQFTPCGLAEVIEVAVDKTIEKGCNKITIPVVANRLTALSLNLRGTAHIVRQAVERKLAAVESDETFEVEFVCTTQAKRHIQQGLDIECRHKQERCCLGDGDNE